MFTKMFIWAVSRLPVPLAIVFCNLLARLRRTDVVFRVVDGLLECSSSQMVHYSGTVRRGLMFLTNGLSKRGNQLREQYLLDRIEGRIEKVVDVGANSGDFLLAFEDDLTEYLGIEPIEEEFVALNRNCKFRKLRQPLKSAASNCISTMEIFVSTSGGDSSLVEPANGFSEKRRIPAVTLDSVFLQPEFSNSFAQIDLLKIEAEGFEPEVLEGCGETLKCTRYVAVDGGPERGPLESTTIEPCANYLFAKGFTLVAINITSRPGVALFRNSRT